MLRLLCILFVLGFASHAMAQDLVATLGSTSGAPGSAINVPLFLDNTTPDPMQGFGFSFWCEDAQLVPQEVSGGAALLALNGGGGPDFLSVNVFPGPVGGSGISCGTVFSFLGADALEPGLGLHALDMTWQVSPMATPGTSSSVVFCNCVGSPPVASVVVLNGQSIVPAFVDSTVVILEPVSFVRGDPNGSFSIDVADPVYVLNYLFQGGPSICVDAMDANSDSTADLADVLFLLAYINGDGPMPSAPFPSCGLAVEVLGCEAYPDCG